MGSVSVRDGIGLGAGWDQSACCPSMEPTPVRKALRRRSRTRHHGDCLDRVGAKGAVVADQDGDPRSSHDGIRTEHDLGSSQLRLPLVKWAVVVLLPRVSEPVLVLVLVPVLVLVLVPVLLLLVVRLRLRLRLLVPVLVLVLLRLTSAGRTLHISCDLAAARSRSRRRDGLDGGGDPIRCGLELGP